MPTSPSISSGEGISIQRLWTNHTTLKIQGSQKWCQSNNPLTKRLSENQQSSQNVVILTTFVCHNTTFVSLITLRRSSNYHYNDPLTTLWQPYDNLLTDYDNPVTTFRYLDNLWVVILFWLLSGKKSVIRLKWSNRSSLTTFWWCSDNLITLLTTLVCHFIMTTFSWNECHAKMSDFWSPFDNFLNFRGFF